MGIFLFRPFIARDRCCRVAQLFVAAVGVLLVATACTSQESGLEAGGQIGSEVTTPPSISSSPSPGQSNPDQLPSTLPIDDKHACDIVDVEVAATAGVVDPERERGSNDKGSVCSYQMSDVSLAVMLTNGPAQGIGELPLEGGQVDSRSVGPFAARQESDGPLCTFAVEVAPGRALSIRYESSRQDDDPCARAESLATDGLMSIAHGA